MIRAVVGWSLRFRVLVLGLAAATLIVGVVTLPSAPVDSVPEFSPPYVEIQTEALGLSAEEVEQLITVPLEADLLNGVAWLESIESESVTGLSSIVITFQPGTDPIAARQMVAERMTQAHALPNVSLPPVMLQPLSSSNRLMMVGLSSDEHTLIDLSVLARWTIRPRLMAVPGVANVAIWGQRERQLQVLVDPERLQAAGVTADEVVEAVGNALWVSPLTFLEASTPGTGGFIDTANQRFGVQHVLPISSPEDLAQIAVSGDEGHRYRLSDVATVVEDHQPLIGDALVKGAAGIDPGLLLVVEKFPEANTLEVTRGVDEALTAMMPGLRGVTVDSSIFRPATFIESAIDGMTLAVLIGLVLLVVVLLGILFSWRAALVSLVALAASITAAALILVAAGATINTMVAVGFVVALGVLIDDGVANATAITPRAAHDDARRLGRLGLVMAAVLGIRGPLFYALLILGLVAVPFLLVGGVAGALLPSVMLAYGAAVLASTLVAMTVTPALAAILMPLDAPVRPSPRVVGAAQRVYGSLLVRLLDRSRPATLVAGAAALGAIAIFTFSVAPSLGDLPAPAFRERDVMVRFDGPPGTSHGEMTRIAGRASSEIAAIPGVQNVGSHVGRAMLSDHVSSINTGEIWVSIDPDADYDSTLGSLDGVIAGYPGLDRAVLSYPEQRLTEIASTRPEDVVVRIYGQDTSVLRAKAAEVREAMTGIPGLSQVAVEGQPDEPSLRIEVDVQAAALYGLKPGDIRRAAATMLAGIQVGSLFEDQKVFEVVVWGAPEHRQSLTSVQGLPLLAPNGRLLRLGDVADVQIAPTPTVIRRDAVQRRIDVGATISGRDPSAVLADVDAALARIQFPLENHAEVLGITVERESARTSLISVGVAALVGVLLLLQAVSASWRLAAAMLLSLPAALSGAVLVTLVQDERHALAASLGLLAVLGIAVRHAILLVAHCRALELDGSERFGTGLVLRAARERLQPVIAVGIATAAATVPFAILGELPGFEMLQPLSQVVLGGLVTSTLLALFVVPTIFLRLGAVRAEAIASVAVEPQVEPRTVGAHLR